jgi:hypothetical protein
VTNGSPGPGSGFGPGAGVGTGAGAPSTDAPVEPAPVEPGTTTGARRTTNTIARAQRPLRVLAAWRPTRTRLSWARPLTENAWPRLSLRETSRERSRRPFAERNTTRRGWTMRTGTLQRSEITPAPLSAPSLAVGGRTACALPGKSIVASSTRSTALGRDVTAIYHWLSPIRPRTSIEGEPR